MLRIQIPMKTHVQIVAALHIAMGALSLLAAFGVFMLMGMAGGIVVANGEREAAGMIGIVAIMLAGFLGVLALPGIIGGSALLTGRAWGRPVVLVVGAFHLLSFPVGTALGVYTFWALLYEPQPASPGRSAVQPIA